MVSLHADELTVDFINVDFWSVRDSGNNDVND